MASEKKEYTKQKSDNKDDVFKNDPETLNTTDPQEHMEGPLSSLMHSIEDKAEDNDRKDEVDKKGSE